MDAFTAYQPPFYSASVTVLQRLFQPSYSVRHHYSRALSSLPTIEIIFYHCQFTPSDSDILPEKSRITLLLETGALADTEEKEREIL